MKHILIDFETEIQSLKDQIVYIEGVKRSLSMHDPLLPYVSSVAKRRFDYISLIIRLYGIVEYYSEKFLITYLEEMTKIVKQYKELHTKIMESHLYNSANLIIKILDKKHHKYEKIDVEQVVSNLHSCLSGDDKYSINYQSFTLLSGNLKHSKICDMYKQVGINIEKGFEEFGDFHHIQSENKYQKLDDLVLRRNEIAHGSTNNIVDLLSISDIDDYIDFTNKYFHYIYQMLEKEINKVKFSHLNPQPLKLANFRVYPDLNVVGFFDGVEMNFDMSDCIITEDSQNNLKFNKVITIKHVPDSDSVTLELERIPNFKLRQNLNFYLYRKECIE